MKNMVSSNSIIKRVYYAIELELISPLTISNGNDYYTDMDVLKNSANEYFIPGTSVAGALRNYHGMSKTEKSVYGFSNGADGKMSSVWISDIYLRGNRKIKTSVRDGVRLNQGKTVENKFDIEIIEPGVKGILYISWVMRKNDDDIDIYKLMNEIIQGICEGDIRFGAKKNRGFGRFRVNTIYFSKFEYQEYKEEQKQTMCRFMKFMKAAQDDLEKYDECQNYEEWTRKYHVYVSEDASKKFTSQYIKVRVPVKLTGGISIRRYSAKPGNADYEHIACNGKPVIPGSSLNGAVRSDLRYILDKLEIQKDRADEVIKKWFGSEKEEEQQSLIIFSESVIEGAEELEVTRNKIDRFTNGTIESALYTERAAFGGKTTFEYLVKKDKTRNYLGLLAVMELIMEDITRGDVAIGGLVSVGRGIFAPDEEKEIVYSEPKDRNELDIWKKKAMEQLYLELTVKGEEKDA